MLRWNIKTDQELTTNTIDFNTFLDLVYDMNKQGHAIVQKKDMIKVGDGDSIFVLAVVEDERFSNKRAAVIYHHASKDVFMVDEGFITGRGLTLDQAIDSCMIPFIRRGE